MWLDYIEEERRRREALPKPEPREPSESSELRAKLKPFLDLPGWEDILDLSVRTSNALRALGLTLRQFLVSSEEVVSPRHIGRKSLDELKDALLAADLRFGMTEEEIAAAFDPELE